MQAKTVNVGVIGVGAFMARQHLPNMLRNSAIRIHTLCDLNEELLQQRTDEFSPEFTTMNDKDIFENPDVDLVMVGTRSQYHAHYVLKAVEHGKHVFVEKPMTMSYEETAKVIRAVENSNVTVGVGFNRRFAPIMIEARELFKSNKKGPANIIYRIVDDHNVRPAYIFDMETGGGHLLQEGCHIFDLLSWFLDAEPVEIFATGRPETDNIVTIKYDDDSIVSLVCGGKGGLFYPKELMEVFCDSHTIAVDQFYELRVDGPNGNFIKTFPLDKKSSISPDERTMTSFYHKSFTQRPNESLEGEHAGNDYHLLKVDKGHDASIAAFADAIANGGTFPINAIDGARATVCALKSYESIEKNLPVKIEPNEYGM